MGRWGRVGALVGVVVLAASGCRVHETLARDPIGAHPLLERAQQAYLEGRKDEALRLFRGYADGFARGDGLATARYWEGVILLERGRTQEAERALEIARHAVDARWLRANILIALGDVAFSRDAFEHAERLYRRALDIADPGARNDYALYRIGVARQRGGDWGGGRTSLERLVRVYPDSPLAAHARKRLAFPLSGFHLEIERYAEADRAAALERELERRGYPARRLHEPGALRPWSVWVGPYAAYADAEHAAAQLGAMIGRRLEILP